MKVEEIAARAAHDVNNAYCRAICDAPSPEWDDMTEAQRAKDAIFQAVVRSVAAAVACRILGK